MTTRTTSSQRPVDNLAPVHNKLDAFKMLPFSIWANVFVFSNVTSIVKLGYCCQWLKSCAYSNDRLIVNVRYCFASTIAKMSLRTSFKGCLEEARYDAFLKKNQKECAKAGTNSIQEPSLKKTLTIPHAFPQRQTAQVAYVNGDWHIYTPTCLLKLNSSYPAQYRYSFLHTPHFSVQFDEDGNQLNLTNDSSTTPLPLNIRAHEVRKMEYYGSSLLGVVALNEVHVIDVAAMKTISIPSPVMLGGMHFLNEKEIVLIPASINESARSFRDIDRMHRMRRSAVDVLTVWDLEKNACSKRFLLPTQESLYLSNVDSFRLLEYDRFLITAAFDSTTGVKLRLIVWDISHPSNPLINQTVRLPQYSSVNVSINRIACMTVHQGMLCLGMHCTQESINSAPKQSVGMLWRFKASDLYNNCPLTEVSRDTLFSTLKASLLHDMGMAFADDQLIAAHVEGNATILSFYSLMDTEKV